MTKREMFVALTSLVALSDLTDADKAMFTEGLNHEIELLDKKSSTPRKPTATQLENVSLKAEILTHLTAADTLKSISDLQKEIPSLSELSNQRITHLLTDLVKEEKIVKEYNKKTPFYAVK